MIDVFIPAYHPKELVEACLNSISSQTLPLRSVTLVDDASPYDLMSLAPKYPSIKFIRNNRTQGIGGNLNRCLELAQAEFVTFVHSDDLMAPEWHASWQKVLQSDSTQAELYMSASAYIDQIDRVKSILRVGRQAWDAAFPENIQNLWKAHCYGVTFSGSLIYRRTFFDRLGPFPCDRYPNNSDLYLNMAGLLTGRLVYLPEVLFYHRQHPGQSVCQTDIDAARTAVRIFKDVREFHMTILDHHKMDLLREPLAVYLAVAIYWLLRGDRHRFREYLRLGKEGNQSGLLSAWTMLFFASLSKEYLSRRIHANTEDGHNIKRVIDNYRAGQVK